MNMGRDKVVAYAKGYLFYNIVWSVTLEALSATASSKHKEKQPGA